MALIYLDRSEGSYPPTARQGWILFLQSIWRLSFSPSVKMCYFMCSDYHLPCFFREHLFLVGAVNLLSHNPILHLDTWLVWVNENLPLGLSQDLEQVFFPLLSLDCMNVRPSIPAVAWSQSAGEKRARSREKQKWEMKKESWCACSRTESCWGQPLLFSVHHFRE